MIWGLEDSIVLIVRGRERIDVAMQRAENSLDVTMMRYLVDINQVLTEIEHKIRDARRGEYRGQRDDE